MQLAGKRLEPAFRPGHQRRRCPCRPPAPQAGRGGQRRHPDRAGRRLYLCPAWPAVGDRRERSQDPWRPAPPCGWLPLMALAVTLLSLWRMGLQYRLVEGRLTASPGDPADRRPRRPCRPLRPAPDHRAAAGHRLPRRRQRTGDEMLLLHGPATAPCWPAPARTGPPALAAAGRQALPSIRRSDLHRRPHPLAGGRARTCRAAFPCWSPAVAGPGGRHAGRPAAGHARPPRLPCWWRARGVGWLAARGVMGADRPDQRAGRPGGRRATLTPGCPARAPTTNSAFWKPMSTPCWTASRT